MKKYKWVIILLNGLILLFYFNYSIAQKEAILSEGKLILFELAPVDPRSLMQGDYMRLSYKIAQDINITEIPKRGYVVVSLSPEGTAIKERLQKDKAPLGEGEYLIKYTSGEWSMNIGAESFFFEEGQAAKYEEAKYGALRADREGNSILTGLYDENLNKIE